MIYLFNIKKLPNVFLLIGIVSFLQILVMAQDETKKEEPSSDLFIMKLDDRKAIAQSSNKDDSFTISTKNLGKIDPKIVDYKIESSHLVEMEISPDIRIISVAFKNTCKVPFLMASYSRSPSVSNSGKEIHLESDFYGYRAYNELKAQEMVIFDNFKSHLFRDLTHVYSQKITFREHRDQPIFVSFLCFAFSTKENYPFSFKVQYKVTEFTMKESFNFKSIGLEKGMKTFNKNINVAASTFHEFSFMNLMGQTDIAINTTEADHLKMDVFLTSDKGEKTVMAYTKDKADQFLKLNTVTATIKITNVSFDHGAEFNIIINTYDNKILGIDRLIFFIGVAVIASVLLIITVIIVVCVCKRKKKRKSSRKAEDEEEDGALDFEQPYNYETRENNDLVSLKKPVQTEASGKENAKNVLRNNKNHSNKASRKRKRNRSRK